ncbi:molybdate ABC transporter substrate-binding protein [Candidatus Hecatella orcuttiae]|uniref:molybdate ABC transporter substrate-binding protein n=1 Tax=Candidatus Hecatella orcuttiae TaxID=1935119 RepID=UPI002868237F|nr:molybdate ABC transporter substrate-binding protein [Candidatus Hecatella orcuttiae]
MGETASTKTLTLLLAAVLTLAIAGALKGANFQAETQPETLVVFSGSVSTPVLEEAAKVFEKETGIKVELHFGGSGTMLSQMKISQSGDLYIPSSHDYMQQAVEAGLVEPETVRILAYLIPAILVPEGNPQQIRSLEDLSKPEVRLGLADPGAVAIGAYAVDILASNGLWEEVEGNVVTYAGSYLEAVSYLTLGQVDAMIGWRVFESWHPDKVDALTIEPHKLRKLSYISGAVTSFSDKKGTAEKFLEFLTSPQGQEIYRSHGYITSLEEAKAYAPTAEVPPL